MSGLSRDLSGSELAALNEVSRKALRVFAAAGFDIVEPGLLLDAENLLDLYGEDVRSRAFVFAQDGYDLCLRPDLTLPICRHHLSSASQRGEAKYAASGPVFRRSGKATGRKAEFRQIGCEWFSAPNAAQAEAEIFRITQDALAEAGVTQAGIITGDLGISFALIDAAPISPRSNARLKRHFWRNQHFASLLNKLGEDASLDAERGALLGAIGSLEPAQAKAIAMQMVASQNSQHVGLRSREEIALRLLEQAEDAKATPVSTELLSAIKQSTEFSGPSGEALHFFRELSRQSGLNINAALSLFEARLAALDERGINAAALPFDGQFGRSLEYYDGFVFEFFDSELAKTDRQNAQLAGGGRYDRLLPVAARAFGAGAQHMTAIGAAIRPEAILRSAGELQ